MQSEWKETLRIAIIGAAFLSCADAHAGNLTLGIGADYASGKYGEPNTTRDLYLPFSVSYKQGAWRAKLVVPYVSVQGNGEVVGGPGDRVVDDRRGRNSGPGNSGGDDLTDDNDGDTEDNGIDDDDADPLTATATSRESGLGDVSLSGTWSAVADETTGLYLDVTARVKFGTASAPKGLGSGENDYGLHIDLDKDIGNATVSVGVGYTLIGDPPGFSYRDVLSASTGLSYRWSQAFSVNTYLSYRQAVRDTSPDQLDIAPGVSFRLNDAQRVSAYVLFGLADGSPDFGGGIAYTYTF